MTAVWHNLSVIEGGWGRPANKEGKIDQWLSVSAGDGNGGSDPQAQALCIILERYHLTFVGS